MSQGGIYLGLPGDLVPQNKLGDLQSTRIGGPIAYPTQFKQLDDAQTTCQNCKSKLVLMLLAHAPLTAESTGTWIENRYLYVFCCVSPTCKGSWRAFRCTWAEPESKPIVVDTPQQQQSAAPAPSDWGLSSNTTEDDTSFDFGDLCSALDNLAAAPASKKPPSTAKILVETNTVDTVLDESRPSLPAFYLHAELESKAKTKKAAGLTVEDENDDEDAGSDSAALPATSLDQAEESWEGEGFEIDSVLVAEGRPETEMAYLKFAERLAQCPDQCARYGFGQELIWPKKEQIKPPACPSCGAERVFELQLMAPVIAYLEEAVEWVKEEQPERYVAPPASWDWLTAAVYTCKRGCMKDNECFLEEYVLACSEF